MTQLDRAVLTALASLPTYAPKPTFADGVLAQVRTPEPMAARTAWPRLALAASVVVSLGASAAWSLLNRDQLLGWIQSFSAETGRTVWLGVRVVATNLTAQPWYTPLREFASSPGRLVLLLGGSLILYAAALVALRRLLTPPSRPVPHANW
ncbi:MAG: hypothetical protein HOP28_01755 [Gemmatimonadales bacterium]|nr:hypothetical protein [Gemmatimonadales bacterium]